MYELPGLGLEYKSRCKCSFCKINKTKVQLIRRWVYDLTSTYKIGSKKWWT